MRAKAPLAGEWVEEAVLSGSDPSYPSWPILACTIPDRSKAIDDVGNSSMRRLQAASASSKRLDTYPPISCITTPSMRTSIRSEAP